MGSGTLGARLRTWRLRLGLSRESNPEVGRGPSNEDIAREQSFAQARLRNEHEGCCFEDGGVDVAHDET